MKSLVMLLAASAFVAGAQADTTGMVGKSYIPHPVPASGNAELAEFGNDYFECGGTVREDGTHFAVLRKGVKAKCYSGKGIVALTRPRTGTEEHEVLDTIDIEYRKKETVGFGCAGADVAISKAKDVEIYTEHVAAWKLIDNKFVPVKDLRTVRCTNQAYGL